MKDYIVRAVAADNQIRAFAATTKNLVEEAKNLHNTSPVATAALGRLLTAGGIMGIMLGGDEDILTLQIKGDGPIGGLTVTADSQAKVKGYVHNPMVMIPASPEGKLDVGTAVGSGYINVIKDLGLREPYSGQTNLVSGEIADRSYLLFCKLGTSTFYSRFRWMNKDNTVNTSGGFIIQLMPFTDDKVVDKLESRIEILIRLLICC